MNRHITDFFWRKTFPKGIHPLYEKYYSAESEIQVAPCPERIVLPLRQNIGAPCKQLVEKGQNISFGEMIAESNGPISAPIHSPVSGTVQKNSSVILVNGTSAEAMVIKPDIDDQSRIEAFDELFDSDWSILDINKYSAGEIRDKVFNAGIVGLGGAAFPTHVKITPSEKKPVETLIVNGCECEPYLTKDYRIMVEVSEAVISGAILSAKAIGATKVVIGVEDNKPKAIEALERSARGTGVKIKVLKTKYPQGSEKQLIYAVTELRVPLGGLPSDVGVGIGNVGTMTAVAMAVVYDKPLTHRVISMSGGGIVCPANLLIPIGISFGELIQFCGGLKPNAARMLAGGPMMGFNFVDPDTPVIKGISGLTVLTQEELAGGKETNCIRCGKCVHVCPMNLVPSRLAAASKHYDMQQAEKYHISACIECGCCAYECPANIPLVQLIRMGKVKMAASAN